MNDSTRPPDTLDRAADALRTAPAPALPDELKAATLAAIQTPLHRARRARRRRTVMKYASASCLLAALAVGLGMFSGVGKANAAEQLIKALGNQAKAKSVRAKITTTADNPPMGTPKEEVMTYYAQRDKSRSEYDRSVVIADGGPKMLILDRVAKTATFIANPPERGANAIAALADHVRKVIALGGGQDKVIQVPPASIGGKSCPGFKVSGVEFLGSKVDMTFWLDEQRELPVRSEMKISGPIKGNRRTEFNYSEKLDAELFELTVPAGYVEKTPSTPATEKGEPAKK